MKDIYSELFDKIISGEYKPGIHLKQEDLAKEFNLSRTPVRTVLQQLDQDGLVELLPNKGAKVLPFSADEVEEIYDIRKSLELLCLNSAISQLSINELFKIKAETIALANSKNDNVKQLTLLDAKLHSYIINTSGKTRLISILSQLFRLIQKFRSLGFKEKDKKEKTIDEHIRIIDALCARNLNLAREEMENHIQNSKMIALSQFLKQKPKEIIN